MGSDYIIAVQYARGERRDERSVQLVARVRPASLKMNKSIRLIWWLRFGGSGLLRILLSHANVELAFASMGW